MSAWTHPQCERCWIRGETSSNPATGHLEVRRPARLTGDRLQYCCYCGDLTISGIYRRADPATLPACVGHEETDE